MQIIVNPGVNYAPSAKAGADQVITLPVNSAQLNGDASTDPEYNIVMYAWNQISGPPGAVLQTGPYIKVTNLFQGSYQFELTVTDHGGLSSKDTMKVTVNGLPTGSPAIFDNLFWFGSCDLRIPSIYSFMTPGSLLNVEVKRYDYQGQASPWAPVRIQGSQLPGDLAYYAIENGNLIVYGINIICDFDDAQSYSLRLTY